MLALDLSSAPPLDRSKPPYHGPPFASQDEAGEQLGKFVFLAYIGVSFAAGIKGVADRLASGANQ